MAPPSPALDEFEQAELDARRHAAAAGYALGRPTDAVARMPVIE